jgi:hypothetical protein
MIESAVGASVILGRRPDGEPHFSRGLRAWKLQYNYRRRVVLEPDSCLLVVRMAQMGVLDEVGVPKDPARQTSRYSVTTCHRAQLGMC